MPTLCDVDGCTSLWHVVQYAKYLNEESDVLGTSIVPLEGVKAQKPPR